MTAESTLNKPIEEKERLHLTKEDVRFPIAFLLTMAMIGLKFPVGVLLLIVLLVNRFQKNKYDFLIGLTIFFGGYSFMWYKDLYINLYNVAFALSLIAMFVVRKPWILKKLLILIAIYAFILFCFAWHSGLPLKDQFFGFRNYLSIIYVFVPFMIFSGIDFDINYFFKRVFIYGWLICCAYSIDSIILGGAFFIPYDAGWNALSELRSVFYSPILHPIKDAFARRWPQGLYFFALVIYPIVRKFKLSFWMWLPIVLAFAVCRTFTFTIALVLLLVLLQRNKAVIFKFALGSIVGLAVLYGIDSMLGVKYEYTDIGDARMPHSTFRIKTHIDQILFSNISVMEDADLAAFASGRGAQIFPRIDYLVEHDKLMAGAGFIDANTTNQKYMFENELTEYINAEFIDQSISGVEVMPIQITMDIGLYGLFLHCLFFIAMWYVIRKLPYSGYYASTCIYFVIVGISGFAGLIWVDSLMLVGISLAVPILHMRKDIPGFSLYGN